MKKENEKKTAKVTIKADTAIAAYNILMNATHKAGEDVEKIKLSVLDTPDMFRALRIANTLKPIAVAFEDFKKDSQKSLGWEDIVKEYHQASDEKKAELAPKVNECAAKVDECVSTELEKVKEIDGYERISEEAFGKLIQGNPWLEVRAIMTLQEVMCE